jgi:hypothetical protein
MNSTYNLDVNHIIHEVHRAHIECYLQQNLFEKKKKKKKKSQKTTKVLFVQQQTSKKCNKYIRRRSDRCMQRRQLFAVFLFHLGALAKVARQCRRQRRRLLDTLQYNRWLIPQLSGKVNSTMARRRARRRRSCHRLCVVRMTAVRFVSIHHMQNQLIRDPCACRLLLIRQEYLPLAGRLLVPIDDARVRPILNVSVRIAVKLL